MTKRVKEVEQSVLATFQEEIPSIYYSDKTEKEFQAFKKNAEYMYRDLLKFPSAMFSNRKLIDFGAGTGENTVYLTNWGAKCTLVEMNEDAQAISRDVFRKYASNLGDHRFIHSSIFDYESDEKYDIVHCRGVLSHTDDKEGAFAKIASFLRPGGYIIFGDPNKAGGFQNMLQRYAIYKFATEPDDMVQVAELLFKDDIDRSQRMVPRTRRCIIFDRWVVQKQNDPTVAEVLQWFDENGLTLYSAWPPVVFPVFGDSAFHQPKYNPQSCKDIGVLTEAVWMMVNEGDAIDVPKYLAPLRELSKAQFALVNYVSDCNVGSIIENDVLQQRIEDYAKAISKVNVVTAISERMKGLLNEVKGFVDAVETLDLEKVRLFVKGTKHLFRGAIGIRHTDYIAYKPD